MATIIDQLLVTLGLDATGYKRGQKEVQDANRKLTEEEQKQAKEQQARQKAAVEGFRAIRNEILTIVSAALGGKALKDFMADATATNRQLGINARNLGMSASRLKAWQDAAKAAGGTAEGLTNSMQGLAQAIEQHQQGNPTEATRMLARMGVNFNEKDIEKLTADVAGALQRIGKEYGPQTQIFAANALGIDAGTLELLRRGKDGVSQLVNQMGEHTKSAGAAEDAARRLGESWAFLQNTAGDLSSRIYTALVPAFEAAANLMRSMLDLVLKLDSSSGGWAIKIGAWSFALLGLVASLRSVYAIIRGILALVGGGAAAGATAGAGAAAARAGLLSRILGPLGLGFLAHEGLALADPNDAIGNWINKNVPGAASVNNWFARNLGIGKEFGAPGSATGGAIGTPGDDKAAFLEDLSRQVGLPPGVLNAQYTQESGRGKNMISPAGATGHFQFMPGTAREMGLSREDTFDFKKSAEAAAKYMAMLYKKFNGDINKALAAYNWGMGNVERKGMGAMPVETINYLQNNARLRAAQGGNTTTSETHIQSLTVNTQVTDAQGFARELPAALGANSLVPNFATGVN